MGRVLGPESYVPLDPVTSEARLVHGHDSQAGGQLGAVEAIMRAVVADAFVASLKSSAVRGTVESYHLGA